MESEPNLIDQLEDQIIDHPDADTKKALNESSIDETFQKRLNERAEQFANSSSQFDAGANGGTSEGNVSGYGPPGSNAIGLQFLITKTHLQYEYKDFEDLQKELSEWFAFNDFATLSGLGYLPEAFQNEIEKRSHDDRLINEKVIEILKSSVTTLEHGSTSDSLGNEELSDALDLLLYYSFGSYKSTDLEGQLKNISHHNKVLYDLDILKPILQWIKSFIDSRIAIDNEYDIVLESEGKDDDEESQEDPEEVPYSIASNYFKILTLFYFILNTFLQCQSDVRFQNLRDNLISNDILSSIIEFIEHWKWNPNTNYRIRYLFLITWKLILIEMGDSSQMSKTDDFLLMKHNIKNKKGKDIPSSKLTCSPLDYFTFREDLMDKYPLYNDDKSKSPFNFKEFENAINLASQKDTESDSVSTKSNSSIDTNYDYFMAMNSQSNSLSNLLELPRPNKVHTVLSQLPAQTVHIATPVPSPPTTPSDYMSGGEKIRKLYHVNQGMPLIYPHSGENGEVQVPYSIKEADEILKNSIYESYSIKRLWDERQKFMIQERGNVNEYLENNNEKSNEEFEYDETLLNEYPEYKSEIKSLLRVESFYKTNICRFNSLIQVLMETIKSNKYDYNLNFAEMELNPETSCINQMVNDNLTKDESIAKIQFVIMQQLEVQKIKEITLKASSAILNLLLKWFKINHVLKFYYLNSLLFDQQYFNILMEFISISINNSNLRRPKDSKDANESDSLSEYETLICQNKLMNPEISLPKLEFFHNCHKLSYNGGYELINKIPLSKLPNEVDEHNINNVTITKANKSFCFILTNLLNVANKILIKNVSQRTFILNESKPSEYFKIILLNYDNDHLKIPILKILKKLIPYQGRKWKSINMDLISLIYLNLKLSLKDNWLSGRDLESDFNNSFDQEIALRSLLQFYNMRKYPDQMQSLGYQVSSDDIPILDLNHEDWY